LEQIVEPPYSSESQTFHVAPRKELFAE
jgi:hypothetical protein